MRTGPSNYQSQQLLGLVEAKAPASRFWRRVAEDLGKPTRQRREVNVYKINQYAQEGETILVPGKVLSLGDLQKKVNVAALAFSVQAAQKITAAKGRTMSIFQLLEENPQGKEVRILG